MPCVLELDRDINAAINILRLGRTAVGRQPLRRRGCSKEPQGFSLAERHQLVLSLRNPKEHTIHIARPDIHGASWAATAAVFASLRSSTSCSNVSTFMSTSYRMTKNSADAAPPRCFGNNSQKIILSGIIPPKPQLEALRISPP